MDKFPNLLKPSHMFATLFGVGLLPFAPGTWGSLFGLILFFYVNIYLSINAQFFYLLLLAIILFSILVCYFSTKELGDNEKDQKAIVIDELAGVWIAFIPVSGIVMMQEFLTYSVLAFLLFRVFDIWKPYPIGRIDKEIKNYLGVVLDDLVAGLYAAITIWLILILF